MDVEELRQAAQPFHPDTVVYVKIGAEYLPIIRSTYMHDEEGHLVLVAGTVPVGKSEGGGK